MGLALLIIASCATSNVSTNRGIQKRKYLKGWSTEKRATGFENNDNQDQSNANLSNTEVYTEDEPALVADNENDIAVLFETTLPEQETVQMEVIIPTSEGYSNLVSSESSCDIIMLKNGDEIEAKVTEIGSYEIKYKLCDNLEGPVYTKPKNEIFKIKYANGTSTLISEIQTEQPTVSVFNEPNTNTGPRDNTQALMWMAITGIILGTLSFLIFGLLFSLAAIALGVTALILLNKKKPEKRSRRVRNLSIWSIIIGAVVFVLTLFLLYY